MMKKFKHALVMLVLIGSFCVLPALSSQADAAEASSDTVLIVAKGGGGGGGGGGTGSGSSSGSGSTSSGTGSAAGSSNPGTASGTSGTGSNASGTSSGTSGSGVNSPSTGTGTTGSVSNPGTASEANQNQTTERLETRENIPEKANVQQANLVMENIRSLLKQIREQIKDQALLKEKWQELREQINQLKEQIKLGKVSVEEAKTILRDCLEVAGEQQNLEEQENILKDLVEIDPADQEAYKELGAFCRLQEKDGIKVFVNGRELKFDVSPVIKEGRTLVPVRALTEGLGAAVSYDAGQETVTVARGETNIVLTIDQKVALVNGQEVTLDTKAELNNNRTFVPLRFIAETFKLKVGYPDEGIVTIISPSTDTATGSNTGNTTGGSTETTTGSKTTAGSTTHNAATENTGKGSR